ncbi:hypothetical protein TPB0596_36780 [Tsukamurella pulmonis]|uniref:hypothetical protein n=1 Tax=Tsukamurella pulmonis TaxID=47312 RepID=UPI001EE1427C|nr:hypothetical protein [Tsukamurella pulmonis]BDD83915.1 hypothetical protein TPB0596_36780 [Tsukamurella pulmonis]
MTRAMLDLPGKRPNTSPEQVGRGQRPESVLSDILARKDFRAWLTVSCERQNLPVTIDDRATVTKVAALLK